MKFSLFEVRHIQEDLYDGQVVQKLVEKLANIKVITLITKMQI